MEMEKPHYNVVAAVITKNAANNTPRIFCARRPTAKPNATPSETDGKWEFPGGKIETGETPEQALAREIREEFGAQIIVGDFITTVEHEYKNFSITMSAFYCILASPAERLELKEHSDSKWLSRTELDSLDWAAADVPIMHTVMQAASKTNSERTSDR